MSMKFHRLQEDLHLSLSSEMPFRFLCELQATSLLMLEKRPDREGQGQGHLQVLMTGAIAAHAGAQEGTVAALRLHDHRSGGIPEENACCCSQHMTCQE